MDPEVWRIFKSGDWKELERQADRAEESFEVAAEWAAMESDTAFQAASEWVDRYAE